MTDKEYIEGIRRQDMLALEHAIESYGGYAAAVVRHTLGRQATKEDLEELVSDVFVALWQNANSLDVDRQLKPWIAVVARNRALNWARAANKAALATKAAEAALVEDQARPSFAILQDDKDGRMALVNDALEALDAENKGLVVNHYLEGRSIKELSATTGRSESSIKSRLFRSRNLMRTYLQQEGFAL